MNGGRALHILAVKPVGESVPSFSCCLGGVHNLASDACYKSLHREVDVFVKLGDLLQLPIDSLAELRQCKLVFCPTLASGQPISTIFRQSWSIRSTHDENSSDH